jgi:UDP-N-acetylmuramoyl-L-alanyl-D-glutamate--2,6-diaminopimelate ligase
VRFSDLLRDIDVKSRHQWSDVEINGISTDSRSIKEGELFVAVRGHEADGHDYTGQAENAGAAALVVENPVEADIPVVVVDNCSAAESSLARVYFEDPSSKVMLIGVTGTNGKTSTAFILQSILQRSHGPTGIIGTVGFGAGGDLSAATNTTPSSSELNRIIASFVDRGCRTVVMEVSSHAAAQGRTGSLEFDIGVFTNISRDHMDYHGNLDNYIEAKEKFVRSLSAPGRTKEQGTLLYNIDDGNVAKVGERFTGPKISFGTSEEAEFRCVDLAADLSGTSFRISASGFDLPVKLQLLGRFSALNALGAAAAAHVAGAGREAIEEGLSSIDEIPGRFHMVRSDGGPTVIVDYAHTPDALEKLLQFCRELSPSRLVTVFGAGGDRDTGKRPMMGKAAAELSDMVYVTSDNPRSEDPDTIIRDILEGMSESDTALEVISDRGEAIRRAIGSAVEGDMVVLAGKGHEDYQVLAHGSIHFSDIEEAEKALAGEASRR